MATTRSEVRINIYDLLPPGYLSSFLWHIGNGLLHSGVVVNGKEYAYGGHDRRGVTGVYWMTPGLEPPGGTFRCGLIHGYSSLSEDEIDEASHVFLGPAWNLLMNNCNHFTSYLCHRLTSQPAPRWLNRAATIGLVMPCMVPREWITPPEGDNEDGELVNNEASEGDEEDTAMLVHGSRTVKSSKNAKGDTDEFDDSSASTRASEETGLGSYGDQRSLQEATRRSSKSRDASGWPIPKSERAPLPESHQAAT